MLWRVATLWAQNQSHRETEPYLVFCSCCSLTRELDEIPVCVSGSPDGLYSATKGDRVGVVHYPRSLMRYMYERVVALTAYGQS